MTENLETLRVNWRIRNWRPKQLFLAWGAYWAALACVTLPRPLLAAWRATHQPTGHNGKITGGLSGTDIGVTISLDDVVTYTSTVPHLLWVSILLGPPLLLAIIWMVRVRRAESAPTALPLERAGRVVTPAPVRDAMPRQ
jgi:hypothetical protein